MYLVVTSRFRRFVKRVPFFFSVLATRRISAITVCVQINTYTDRYELIRPRFQFHTELNHRDCPTNGFFGFERFSVDFCDLSANNS